MMAITTKSSTRVKPDVRRPDLCDTHRLTIVSTKTIVTQQILSNNKYSMDNAVQTEICFDEVAIQELSNLSDS